MDAVVDGTALLDHAQETELLPLTAFARRPPRCMCGFKRRRTCCAVVTLAVLFLLAVLIVAGRFLFAPALIQSYMDKSSPNFKSVILSNPMGHSLRMVSVVSFSAPPSGLTVSFTADDVNVAFRETATSTVAHIGTFGVHDAATLLKDGTVTMVAQLTIENVEAFANMTHQLYTDPSLNWVFQGTMDVAVTLAGITVTIPTKFAKDVTLAGCDGLPDVHILDFDVRQTGAQPVVHLEFQMFNPSPVNIIPIGDVSFVVSARVDGEFVQLGPPAKVDNFSLVQGNNTLHAVGVLDPDKMDVANQLFTQYLAGVPTYVQATVPADGTPVPLYSRGLEGMSLITELPGNTVDIIQAGTGVINATLIVELLEKTHHIDVPVRLQVDNTFDVPLTMFAVEGYVLFNNSGSLQPVGFVDLGPGDQPNITVPAATNYYAPEVPITVLLGDPHVVDDIVIAFLQVFKTNESHVSIFVNISIQVGTTDFAPEVAYKAFDIPLYISPPV